MVRKGTGIRRRVDLEVGHAEADIGVEVEVGDRLVPPVIDVTFPGADGQPGLSMRLEVVNGMPQCRGLHLESVEGGRAVRQSDLAAVRLAQWVDDIFAMFASRIIERHEDGSPAAAVGEVVTAERHQAAIGQFRSSRTGKGSRKLTNAFLVGVTDVYRKHFDANPTQAVAVAYGVKPRTASLYVQLARDAGLLPRTTRGRKRA